MTRLYPLVTANSPIGSVDAYIANVNQIPLLTQEEETAFAKRFIESEDIEAARNLVLAHLRYVVRVARGYMGYGLPLADLIQEGNIGLMKAVKRFDPGFGVRLVSFAVHWIKAEIHEYILRNWRIVKIATTKAQRKLFFNLRQFKKRLGWFTQAEVAEVAKDLGVTSADVLAMEQRLNGMDMSLEADNQDEYDEHFAYAPIDTLVAENSDPLELLINGRGSEESKEALFDALTSLDERSRDIQAARWLSEEKATLHELAALYGVSAERVRQLEQNAMKKLKAALLREVA